MSLKHPFNASTLLLENPKHDTPQALCTEDPLQRGPVAQNSSMRHTRMRRMKCIHARLSTGATLACVGGCHACLLTILLDASLLILFWPLVVARCTWLPVHPSRRLRLLVLQYSPVKHVVPLVGYKQSTTYSNLFCDGCGTGSGDMPLCK